MAREGVAGTVKNLLAWITWLSPRRPLTQEFDRILAVGTLKGADLWHLACALKVAPQIQDLTFATTDGRQGQIAQSLGFKGL